MMSRCLAVCLMLVLAVPAMAETKFTPIGSFTGPNRVVYYGTDFYPQAGSIDLGEDVVGPDTTYTLWFRFPGNPTLAQLGIERLPFDSKADAKEPPVLTASQQQRFDGERQIGQQVRARRAAASQSKPVSAAQAMTDRIATTKANPAVEDAWPDAEHPTTVWWVKWKGQADPERNVVSPAPAKIAAARRRANLIKEADRLLAALNSNQIVIIDNGFRHASSSAAGRLALEQDLTALRQGQAAVSFVPTRQVREHLRQSVDLRVVVEGRSQ